MQYFFKLTFEEPLICKSQVSVSQGKTYDVAQKMIHVSVGVMHNQQGSK